MANALGEIAAFEISRCVLNGLSRPGGKLIEIDLISSTMTKRTVLKMPRCSICSPLHERASTRLRRELFDD
jgi:hypothetical protein